MNEVFTLVYHCPNMNITDVANLTAEERKWWLQKLIEQREKEREQSQR